MNSRPFILKGNISIKNFDKCIIGKILKNRTIDDKNDYIQLLDDEHINLFEEGYKGYIFESLPTKINLKKISFCYGIENYDTLIDYDVVEIIDKKMIRVLYREDSEDNVIVVTNQCNSNCIMCPDSNQVRNTKENPDIKKLLEYVRCIPNDTRHITITGGEPGLLKENLITLLRNCKENLPNTEFLILTNGRIFSNTEFTKKIKEAIPKNARIAIPIYADNEIIHDQITQVKGSFKQTILGIKKLLKEAIDIEIRIVVMKKNYQKLKDISEFIVKEIPKVKMTNIMALEMSGNAYINREQVWIDFDSIREHLYEACAILIKQGIITRLYNFPLCCVDEKLYSIANKSITDYKIRYKEECKDCLEKESCGGFFFSTINFKDIKVKPIK